MSGNEAVDLIFVNGAVYTVDAARSWAQAVAVREGRIVAVGTDADVRELDRPADRGRGSRPGACSSPGSRTRTSTRSAAASTCCSATCTRPLDGRGVPASDRREYAAANPDVPWILGGGWSMDVFPGGTPTEDALDRVVPDRPVFLPNRDGHSAWVNSRALEDRRHHARHARPRRRPHRARRAGRAGRDAARGRDGPRRRPRAGPDAEELGTRGSSRARRTCTRWASPRGRTRSSDDQLGRQPRDVRAGRRGRASSRLGSSAHCGGTGIAGSSRSRSS